MNIRLSELRAVADRLFSHLEQVCGPSVDLELDYYWDVDVDARYNMNENPPTFVAGQLTDDWEAVHQMVDPDTYPLIYHFVWLSAILRAIGEASNQPGSGIGPG